MKNRLLTTIAVLTIALFYGCKKDIVTQQEQHDTFYPRIFNEAQLFPTTAKIVGVGDSVKFNGLLYSPAKVAEVTWKVNGTTVATGENYSFVPATGGDFFIKVVVSYNGDTTTRMTEVLVNSATYTHKQYTQIAMSYLTGGGSAANVDWNNVTHVAYKGGTVKADGTLDVSAGEVNNKALELVTRAHIHGVPVLLGISGQLSQDGWSVYPSDDFGNTIADPAKRALLVQAIKIYLAAKKMDGIDIMNADISLSTTAAINASIAAIKPFIDELRAALPNGSLITVTATTDYYYSRYPDLSGADWVNLHAFEDEVHVGPNAPLGASSTYDYMVASAQEWGAKLSAKKLVIGIPAFGLRYNAVNASGNCLSWGSYDYVPYVTILGLDATASDKDYLSVNDGLYFNGVPLVTQKAAYIKQNGYAGAYLWGGDYDVLDSRSLMAAIYKQLN